MSDAVQTAAAKPLWRKIIDFPLVTMVLALAILVLVLTLAATVVARMTEGDSSEVASYVAGGTFVPLMVFAAYKLIVRHMGDPKRDDLPMGRQLLDLPIGIAAAGILMSVIVGVTALLGGYRIVGSGGVTSWPLILFAAGTSAAFLEELLMRGIIFRYLEDFGGSWFALALSSLVFGFMHAWNDNATVLSSVAIAVEAGILLGGAYMLTRNLWLAIGIHFGWNVIQGLVWDVPISGNAVDGIVDARISGPEIISGGAFGLEASVVAMVLATAAGVWLVVLAARRGHIVKPWWVRRREQAAVAQTKL